MAVPPKLRAPRRRDVSLLAEEPQRELPGGVRADLLDLQPHRLGQLVDRRQRAAVLGRQDRRRDEGRERQVGRAKAVAEQVSAAVRQPRRDACQRRVDDRPLRAPMRRCAASGGASRPLRAAGSRLGRPGARAMAPRASMPVSCCAATAASCTPTLAPQRRARRRTRRRPPSTRPPALRQLRLVGTIVVVVDDLARICQRRLADVEHGHGGAAPVTSRRQPVQERRVAFLGVGDPAPIQRPARRLAVRADGHRGHMGAFGRGVARHPRAP